MEPTRRFDSEDVRRQKAAAELLRRRRAVASYHTYCMSIDIPGVLGEAPEPDESLCPAEYLYADHHRIILHAIQRTINRPFGRRAIQAPPGSAKSTYASVTLPPYVMSRREKFKFILTSYASELAWKQSKRAMQIIEQPKHKALAWPYDNPLDFRTQAAHSWELNNGSECTAAGLMAGITGNRADGWVIDDPVAGQKEADSASNRDDVWKAYNGDLLTRVKPEAWGIIIMTRWHEDDLLGRILPEKYKGESGIIIGKDGLEWEVLNIPAKAERPDDPLQRKPGQYLWPEYFPEKHWRMFEDAPGAAAQRVWTSLYQQRPTPQGAGMFTTEMFNRYDKEQLPPRLAFTGAGDYAVTKDGGDFTELGVVGLDESSNMWFIDWWYGQETSDVWIEETLDMCTRYNIFNWFNEGGVIDKSTRPAFNKRMRERQKEAHEGRRQGKQFVTITSIPSMQDKVAKLQAFQARCAAGTVWMPKGAIWDRLIESLCGFPAMRHDDGPDVCGLLGRAIDSMPIGAPAAAPREPGLVPFTAAWLEYEEKVDNAVRIR